MTHESTPNKSKNIIQIVDTSDALFMNYGIKKITVEKICQQANVSKMTFYKYFKNKTDLVKYIIYFRLENKFEEFDRIITLTIPITEKLKRMIEWEIELYSDMDQGYIKEYSHFNPELTEFIQEYMQKSYKRFVDYIIDWQKNGDIRQEISPEFIIAVFDILQELFGDDNLKKLYPNNNEFTLELYNMFFYGILPRPYPYNEVVEKKG
jgi:AcrR family transcriptional regulator